MKVSVYCFAYNHEKFIRDTLEGFVNQITDFEYEVFVHEDASTDNTKKIIQEYESKYPEIIKPIYQTVNQYSRGVNLVEKYIFPKMSGEYVAICEGDDYWSDRYKLQKQVDFLDNHPEYGACVHNTVVLDMDTHGVKLLNAALKPYDLDIKHVILEGSSDYHTSAVMYRMEYAKVIYSADCPEFYHKPKNIEDYPLAIYLVLHGKVRYLPDVMSVYRYGTPGSFTKSISKLALYLEVRRSVIDMLKSVDEYTGYKLHKEIEAIVEERYWEIMVLSTDIRVLKEPEIQKVFRKQSFIQKIKTVMKLLFLNKYRMKKRA